MFKSFIGVLSVFVLCAAAACGDDSAATADGGTNGNDSGVEVECGNGIVEGSEECDDGLSNSDTEPDACRANCTEASCGDGVNDSNEGCDDGSSNSDTEPDACRTDCAAPACGDNVVDVEAGEECDDGNLIPQDGCNASCLHEYCGNGVREGVEVCDDGNLVDGDGCSADCLSDESCGNSIVDTAAGEGCDDGNHASHDYCSSICAVEGPVWVERTTATSPPARINYALVYDSTRARTLLFGGFTPSVHFADLWAYNGTSWQDITPATTPTARDTAAMAYDPVRDVVVLFGGFNINGDVYYSDTWEFDGTTWTQRSPATSPPARRNHAMVYDPVRGAVVLFGGEIGTFPLDLGDTWEWNGTTWTEVTPSAATARHSHGMVWDAVRSRIVMHGGIDLDPGGSPSYRELNDTWENDGTGWQLVSIANPPDIRPGVAMAYDTNRALTVVFSGNTGLADTWEYDGVDWLEVVPTAAPLARQFHRMVFDGLRRRAVIFGGLPQNVSMGHLRDTWEYWVASALPDEQCDNGTDDDSDGEVDCADPDCEGLSCATGTCSGGACQ